MANEIADYVNSKWPKGKNTDMMKFWADHRTGAHSFQNRVQWLANFVCTLATSTPSERA